MEECHIISDDDYRTRIAATRDPPFGEGRFTRESTEERTERKRQEIQDETERLEIKRLIESQMNEVKHQIGNIMREEAMSALARERRRLEVVLDELDKRLSEVNKTLSFSSRFR